MDEEGAPPGRQIHGGAGRGPGEEKKRESTRRGDPERQPKKSRKEEWKEKKERERRVREKHTGTEPERGKGGT